MPNRLVYSPRVYGFTKNAQGDVLDISPYIVSGEVIRNINQASTASLVLRNPEKIFTSPKKGIAFHPQDPITIYLERLAGYPVRVFTGYLDTTPYLQLQPAVIQLQATCTLKRLLYSYFDPSLPYMISFFEKYGWINTGQGSIIATSSYGADNLKQNKSQLENSSIPRLLWGLLYDIGDWDDTDIWIEPIPTGANGIVSRVLNLMNVIDTKDQEAASELEQIFNSMLGGDSQSINPSNTNTVTSLSGNGNVQKAFNVFVQLGLSAIAASGLVGNFMQESGTDLNPTAGDSGSYGIAQWSTSRHNNLIQYCKNATPPFGSAPLYGSDTLIGQCNFVWYELNNSYQDVLENLTKATTPGQAATIVCGTGTPASGGYENPGTPELQNRIQYANDVYTTYNDDKNTSVSSKPGVNKSTKSKKIKQSESFPFSISPSGNGFNSASVLQSETSNDSIFDRIVQAANAIANAKYPYIWGGGHDSDFTPSFGHQNKNGTGNTGVGYDCSGAVSAVLYAAGMIKAPFDTADEEPALVAAGGVPVKGTPPGAAKSITVWVNPGSHTFMQIGGTNGQYWGTTDGPNQGNSQGGPGWLEKGNNPPENDQSQGFTPYYFAPSLLTKSVKYQLKLSPGSSTINDPSGGSGSDSTINDTISQASAEAFTQQLDFPSIEDSIVAIMLGSEGKGLMHDQELLPFVQQVCQASMRNFMSLPDGSFYAFYPDYFGEMGQHNPYWMIDDIEITSGTISITDDALSTHVYAVGDSTWPIDDSLLNELFSAGTITVFNAFQTGLIEDGVDKNGLGAVLGTKEALAFIKRYGARPLVQEYPMIRSSVFEMLMAYQLFMTAWSNQFLSTFNFTFMPEIFPGGKIGFPSHGLMMYVNQVTHTFDYTEGFETTAQLSSPSLIPGYSASDTGLPPNMVAALNEPIRNSQGDAQEQTETTQNSKIKKPAPNFNGFSNGETNGVNTATVPFAPPPTVPYTTYHPFGA